MAAGFTSIRRFNDTMAAVFNRTPTALREMADSPAEHAAGTIVVRVSVREPFDSQTLLRFFAAHAVPGIEEIDGAIYRRSLQLPHGTGAVALTARTGYVEGVRLVLREVVRRSAGRHPWPTKQVERSFGDSAGTLFRRAWM
ncbi:AlkA N-terminal domain-containing protein [Streptomyces sp. NRRL F-5755]|uniref:AlkA N-terminal domain-containing protein n=1 Tax=Streptomyces sp. NRRL F-5755 TaxID=1519475 RepID=UPI0006B04544